MWQRLLTQGHMLMKRWFPPLVYLNVPNAMTSLAVALGLVCLVLLAHGYQKLPAALFLVILILDFADGAVARRLNQSTPIGLQLDSLSDLLNFCMLPVLVGWMMGMRSIPSLLALVLFLLAGVWRLAYYNIHGLEGEGEGRPTFTGLPTTYAACYFVALAAHCQVFQLPFSWLGPLYFVGASLLMLSAIRVPKKGLFLPITTLLTWGSVVFFLLQ